MCFHAQGTLSHELRKTIREIILKASAKYKEEDSKISCEESVVHPGGPVCGNLESSKSCEMTCTLKLWEIGNLRSISTTFYIVI